MNKTFKASFFAGYSKNPFLLILDFLWTHFWFGFTLFIVNFMIVFLALPEHLKTNKSFVLIFAPLLLGEIILIAIYRKYRIENNVIYLTDNKLRFNTKHFIGKRYKSYDLKDVSQLSIGISGGIIIARDKYMLEIILKDGTRERGLMEGWSKEGLERVIEAAKSINLNIKSTFNVYGLEDLLPAKGEKWNDLNKL